MMHFSREERSFVDRSTDWISQALEYQMITTPFLNPREKYILGTLVNRESSELAIVFDGGYTGAERCRAVLGYSFMFNKKQPEETVSFLRISTHDNNSFHHRDVLGSILGLGIKREKVGDISKHMNGCDLVVATEIVTFIETALQKIGRISVQINHITRNSFLLTEENTKKKMIFVSSMRLDAILAEALQRSRAQVANDIHAGKCRVNWQIIDSPSQQVQFGDILSVRGFGRIALVNDVEITKKGRYKLLVELYI